MNDPITWSDALALGLGVCGVRVGLGLLIMWMERTR